MTARPAVKPTHLSSLESLEQLAWIEEGFHIDALDVPKLPLAVNTPPDFEVLKQLLRET